MEIVSFPADSESAVGAAARGFVRRNERLCVPLAARIMRGEGAFFCALDGGRVAGVLSYSAGGQILHCFPAGADGGDARAALAAFFSRIDFSKLFSVIGAEPGTSLVTAALADATGRAPRVWERYVLMARSDGRGGNPALDATAVGFGGNPVAGGGFPQMAAGLSADGTMATVGNLVDFPSGAGICARCADDSMHGCAGTPDFPPSAFPSVASAHSPAADAPRFLSSVPERVASTVSPAPYAPHISSCAPQSATLSAFSPPPPPLSLRRCTPADFLALLPLEESYEREEVLLAGQEFNLLVCRALLRRAFGAGRVYAAFAPGAGVPVAKAAVAAEGERFWQLGGVFTLPAWRRRGISRRLVEAVCADARAAGRGVALFAKETNAPARNLYDSCGFLPVSPFKICYY